MSFKPGHTAVSDKVKRELSVGKPHNEVAKISEAMKRRSEAMANAHVKHKTTDMLEAGSKEE